MIINVKHAVTALKHLKVSVTMVHESATYAETKLRGSYLPQVSGSRDQAFTARTMVAMEEENKT